MELEIFQPTFKKYPNIKFYENPSTGSRVVPYGWRAMTSNNKMFIMF